MAAKPRRVIRRHRRIFRPATERKPPSAHSRFIFRISPALFPERRVDRQTLAAIATKLGHRSGKGVSVMMKTSGHVLADLGRLARAFVAEMVMTGGALFEQRRISRLKSHLDWSEGAQRNRRLKR